MDGIVKDFLIEGNENESNESNQKLDRLDREPYEAGARAFSKKPRASAFRTIHSTPRHSTPSRTVAGAARTGCAYLPAG